MLENVKGFEWDTANIQHIARHSVMPAEVEEAAQLHHVITGPNNTDGEDRWILYGKTARGRYLTVIFTLRQNRFRSVTAYPMNETDRRKYAPQIG